MENVFNKISKAEFTTKFKNNKTILDKLYFTAPFKIMHPFYITDNYIKVMIMSSSAGIMAGDCQEYNIEIGTNTKAEVTSQSYEKIHKMPEGRAERNCSIKVCRNAFLKYNPQPVIPFAHSNFESRINAELEDESSQFILCDIISCGRAASGEKFEYTRYKSSIEVRCAGKLIYKDNTVYEPSETEMSGYGFFENYTHLANIFIGNIKNYKECEKELLKILDSNNEVSGGFSLLKDNNINIKILGNSGQKLSQISECLIDAVMLKKEIL